MSTMSSNQPYRPLKPINGSPKMPNPGGRVIGKPKPPVKKDRNTLNPAMGDAMKRKIESMNKDMAAKDKYEKEKSKVASNMKDKSRAMDMKRGGPGSMKIKPEDRPGFKR